MTITYPPEMLPTADDPKAADIVVLSDRQNELLERMPMEIWTEGDDGQACLELARLKLCTYPRLNATLGRFVRR